MTVRGALLALVGCAALALIASGCGGASVSSHQAKITIHYSHFSPEAISVPLGVPVTITLRNDDPIEHEWIVGNAEVHERHRTGTEAFHGSIPTEVTIPPLSTRLTTITFDRPGDVLYICHLPGHEAYGMVGTLSGVEGS